VVVDTQTKEHPSPVAPAAALGAPARLLLCRIGARQYAVPVLAVERVLPMARFTPLPDAPRGVAGVLSLRGALLPVVDPRPRLLGARGGCGAYTHDAASPAAPQAALPDQHLLLLALPAHGPRCLLWVDEAQEILEAPLVRQPPAGTEHTAGIAPWVAQVSGRVVPVLSIEALAAPAAGQAS
jgi:purine-binding chemotaxis protein CheW